MVEQIEIKMDWEKIIEIEPKIEELYQQALRESKQIPSEVELSNKWHRDYKPVVRLLVHSPKNPQINNAICDNIVYSKIYDALKGKQ